MRRLTAECMPSLHPAGTYLSGNADWWSGHICYVSNAATVIIQNRAAQGITADTAQVYYETETGGGSAVVAVNYNNSGTWETLATLSGDATASLQVYKTNLTTVLHAAEGPYQLRITGTGGGTTARFKFVGGGVYVKNRPCIKLTMNTASGHYWSDWTNMPAAYRQTFLTNDAPDLIIVEMKTALSSWSNDFPVVLNQITNLLPKADILLIGTPQLGTNNAYYLPDGGVPAENQYLRALALQYNVAYWDGFWQFPTMSRRRPMATR